METDGSRSEKGRTAASQRCCACRRWARTHPSPQGGWQALGPGAAGLAVRRGHVRGDRSARHARLHRLRHGGPARARGWIRHRLRQDRQPLGLCVRSRFHGVRRVAVAPQCPEDLQDHGSRDEDRRPGNRSQRLGRRANPRGSGFVGRLCRDLPPQYAGERCGSPDLRSNGAVRRRRCVLTGDHRFRVHGGWQQSHVRYRSGRHSDGDQRGDQQGASGRGADAQRNQRFGPLPRRRRHALRTDDSRAADLPALQQRRRPARAPDERSPGSVRPGVGSSRSGGSESALRHQDHREQGCRRRVFLRGPGALRLEHRGGLRAAGGPPHRDRGQSAGRPSRLLGHRRIAEGSAFRALLRRLRHSYRHVRGCARLPAR